MEIYQLTSLSLTEQHWWSPQRHVLGLKDPRRHFWSPWLWSWPRRLVLCYGLTVKGPRNFQGHASVKDIPVL